MLACNLVRVASACSTSTSNVDNVSAKRRGERTGASGATVVERARTSASSAIRAGDETSGVADVAVFDETTGAPASAPCGECRARRGNRAKENAWRGERAGHNGAEQLRTKTKRLLEAVPSEARQVRVQQGSVVSGAAGGRRRTFEARRTGQRPPLVLSAASRRYTTPAMPRQTRSSRPAARPAPAPAPQQTRGAHTACVPSFLAAPLRPPAPLCRLSGELGSD